MIRQIPWCRKWQPASVFLPGKPQGKRSLVGYRPQGHTKSGTTEGLTMHAPPTTYFEITL